MPEHNVYQVVVGDLAYIRKDKKFGVAPQL